MRGLLWQPSEIELAELVAGKLKLRDGPPPSHGVCYYTDMEDVRGHINSS